MDKLKGAGCSEKQIQYQPGVQNVLIRPFWQIIPSVVIHKYFPLSFSYLLYYHMTKFSIYILCFYYDMQNAGKINNHTVYIIENHLYVRHD